MSGHNQFSARITALRELETEDTKVCTTCEVPKPLSDFYRYVGQYKDTYSRCKPCQREYSDSRKLITQESRLKRKYDMTAEAYEQLLVNQKGCCALCGTNDSGHPSGRFVVDHNHDTGFVRGLLCSGCNVGLGHFRDSPILLLAAFGYLSHSRGERDGNTSESKPQHANQASLVLAEA